MELVNSGRVNVKELITKKVSFRDAEAAFHEVKASKGIKTLIEGIADDGAVSTLRRFKSPCTESNLRYTDCQREFSLTEAQGSCDT